MSLNRDMKNWGVSLTRERGESLTHEALLGVYRALLSVYRALLSVYRALLHVSQS